MGLETGFEIGVGVILLAVALSLAQVAFWHIIRRMPRSGQR